MLFYCIGSTTWTICYLKLYIFFLLFFYSSSFIEIYYFFTLSPEKCYYSLSLSLSLLGYLFFLTTLF